MSNYFFYRIILWIQNNLSRHSNVNLKREECEMDNGKDAQKLIQKGLDALSKNKNEKALELFTQALKFEPKNTMAWNNKGVALRKLGKIDEAINCYDKALSISPDSSQTLVNKARAQKILKKFDLALFTYEDILELDPEHQEALEERERVRNLLAKRAQISSKGVDITQLENKEIELLQERKKDLVDFLEESQLSINDSVQRIMEMFTHGIKEEALDQREKITRAIVSFNSQITERVKAVSEEFSTLDFEKECQEELAVWHSFKDKKLAELQKMG